MRGLTPIEAEVLILAAAGAREEPVLASPAQRTAAYSLEAVGRIRLDPRPEYGPRVRRIIPTPAGREALAIWRSIQGL